MKKLIIISILLVLGLSLVAYTASVKLDFYHFDATAPDKLGELAEGCFAIVNETPKEAANEENVNDTVATIQIQVRGLDPVTEYTVKSGRVELAKFTTKKNGSGSLHCNLPFGDFVDEGDLGKRLNIYLVDARLYCTPEF